MEPIFFTSPAEMRAWFEEYYMSEKEAWIGFYKKGSGMPSITWPEAVDEALCAGWIAGARMGIDEVSYKIRFTPRKPNSIWSAVNVTRMGELIGGGLCIRAEGGDCAERGDGAAISGECGCLVS